MGALTRRTLFAGISATAALGLGCSTRRRIPAATASRVVSLSPSTTETLFALAAGAKLVGRSRFCDYPPEVRRLPSVGGYVDASLEAILALTPDLVVGARGPAGPALVQRLESLGIATFFPVVESMVAIDAMIVALADKVGAHDRGTRLVGEIDARRDAVARAAAALPRVRVLLVFGVSPIVVAGPDSFPGEMLRLVNAENVVSGGGAYPTIGAERLIASNPDRVINAAMAGAPEGEGEAISANDPGWRELAAVREGRVDVLREESVLRPGPRIGDGLAALARAVHPEARLP